MTKHDLYYNFAANIEIERDRLRLTQQKMADKLGISLTKYKTLITNPLESIIDIYLCHKVYDLTGKTVRELCGDTVPEIEMLNLYRDLPKHRKEAIRYLIEVEHQLPRDGRGELEGDRTDAACSSEDGAITCFIPTGNMVDGMVLDSRDMITVDVSEYRRKCHDRIDCAIKITSNHLHPVYMKGDILLISKRAPRDGDVGIFILKETRQMFIREFKQMSPCELRPINDHGDTIYVDSDSKAEMYRWIKFGTVITTMR